MPFLNIRKTRHKLLENLLKLKLFLYIIRYFPTKSRKRINSLLNLAEIRERKKVLNSYPKNVSINISNLCNLRCKFCEIHYFYWKAKQVSGKVFSNNLDLGYFKHFSDLFKNISSIELSGSSGEPFINENFGEIAHYLTKKCGVYCTATTNGVLITDKMAEELVKMPFGNLLFSIHGANKDIYKDFQGEDINKVFDVIHSIQDYKEKYSSPLPKIFVYFLVCKKNTEGVLRLMDKLKELNIDSFLINHYYDSRNKLPKEISFYFDKEEGDRIVKEIYNYAQKIGLTMSQKEPPLLNITEEKNPIEKMDSSCLNNFCAAPYETILFKGCVEYENSHYVAVCNRVVLFRLNYREFFDGGGKFPDIWNHELLQFFRATVGKNPVCKFCMNPETPKVRCMDNVDYSKRRDRAVRDLFKNFKQEGILYRDIKGLFVLDENPYEYKDDEEY